MARLRPRPSAAAHQSRRRQSPGVASRVLEIIRILDGAIGAMHPHLAGCLLLRLVTRPFDRLFLRLEGIVLAGRIAFTGDHPFSISGRDMKDGSAAGACVSHGSSSSKTCP